MPSNSFKRFVAFVTFSVSSSLIPFLSYAQINELTFNHQYINFSAAPRTTISPMSIKLWDNYNNGGPSAYGTVMEIYGLTNHQTTQLYFGGWDDSKIKYREAFYEEGAWSNWITLLDSKNNIQSAGNLFVNGNGNSFISGNLGIGTLDPKGYKLAVAGNMIAESIKVKLQNAWPDYVFSKSYLLPTLQETEKHIKENGHLPGIPSANEVKTNGIDLGEMNAKLLQKIEELTLHLIEKDKQITELQKLTEKVRKLELKIDNR